MESLGLSEGTEEAPSLTCIKDLQGQEVEFSLKVQCYGTPSTSGAVFKWAGVRAAALLGKFMSLNFLTCKTWKVPISSVTVRTV